MEFLEEEHAEAGLADAAADGEGEFVVEQSLVPVEFPAVEGVADFELLEEGFFIDADAHGAEFEGAFEQGVPDEDVAVESAFAVGGGGDPVVVVGCTAVVWFTVGQLVADADDERGAVFLEGAVFSFARFQVGILLSEVFGVDEGDFVRQERFEVGVFFMDGGFGGFDSAVDGADDLFEEVEVAILSVNDPFPVPLIDVDGMDVVERFLVGADGGHVGVESFAVAEAVVGQDHAFPFGQGEDDLGVGGVLFDLEGYFSFDAVEIVVDSGAFADEQGGGDALEVESVGKIILEEVLNELYGFFGFSEREF